MVDRQKWYSFSLAAQMGHIGSEISRARGWEEKNRPGPRQNSLNRALDLIDLTLEDPRHQNRRLNELARFREVVCDWYGRKKIYDISPEQLERYCMSFIKTGTDVIF